MENLTLKDGTAWTRRSSPQARRRPISRLPTPEASRNSDDTLEAEYDVDERNSAKRARHTSSSLRPGQSVTTPNSPFELKPFELPLGHQSAPQSPPYRGTEPHRPSLPPLKMILGQTMSSPPQTPVELAAPLQPCPREPLFTSTAYKPLAFYPNKKQRNEQTCEGEAPMRDVRGSLSSLLNDPLTSRPAESQVNRGLAYRHVDRSPEQGDPRRYSVQFTELPSRRLSKSETTTTTRFEPGMPPMHRENGDYHRYAAGQTSAEATHYKQYASIDPSQPHTRHFSTRLPVQGGPDRHRGSISFEPRAPTSYTYPPMNEPQPVRRDSYQSHLDGLAHRTAHQYQHSPYEVARSSFFMTSQYDHQQGKARKRSNLPKQSTEIMKTWFDQNITNPYPSEEQKALFSRATGISMTQVSNWFINHRRRCPELRDRRDKHRGSSRDVEMM